MQETINKSNENCSEVEKNKQKRTNTKDPNRREKIRAAIHFILQNEPGLTGTRRAPNLKKVSQQFNIPYNTLRDNFLRFK